MSAQRVTLDDFNAIPTSTVRELSRNGFKQEPDTRHAVATPFSKINREATDWLDAGRVPIGKVTILSGYGGLGKSQWMLRLAALLSRGELGDPGVALVATAEDDVGDTVRPRLEALGADLGLVHAITMRMSDGDEDGLSLPDDLTEVEARVEELKARLLIVDPIVAFLPESVDAHKDQSVRRCLAPLHRMAAKYDCAVVASLHLNKSNGLKPLQRLCGSGGFGNAARSVLLLDHDPDDPDGEDGSRRVLAQIKTNISRTAPSQILEIQPILLPAIDGMPEVETSRLELVGDSPHNGVTLLAGAGEQQDLNEAEEFLLDLLSDGARHPAADIYREATKHHISSDRLKRARKKIGAKNAKADFNGGWEWWLETNRRVQPAREELHPSHSSNPSWRNATSNEESNAPFDTRDQEREESEGSESPREDELTEEIERLAVACRAAQETPA
jgi:hypothetical protein